LRKHYQRVGVIGISRGAGMRNWVTNNNRPRANAAAMILPNDINMKTIACLRTVWQDSTKGKLANCIRNDAPIKQQWADHQTSEHEQKIHLSKYGTTDNETHDEQVIQPFTAEKISAT